MLYTKLSGMCHVKDPSPFAIRQTSSASCPLSTLVTPRSGLHIWYNRHFLINSLCHLLIYTLPFTHLFNIWHFRLFISVFESYCLLMKESFESFTQHSFRNKTSDFWVSHLYHSFNPFIEKHWFIQVQNVYKLYSYLMFWIQIQML